MRVAIFASAFYPHVGGVEELCRQLAHAYTEKGVPTIVLTNRWPRSLPEYELYEGIPLYRFPMRTPEVSRKAALSYALTHGRVCSQMLKVLQRHRITLLHVQCVSSNGHYALRARQATGLPLVVTAQGERTMDASRVYERSRFQNQVLRDLLREADYVTACSADTLDDIRTYGGDPLKGRSEVIYNGIRMADFTGPSASPHPRPYVLGIGRLVPQKGFDLLIDAYAQAGIRTHDLLLAGEGTEREALEARVRAHGLQDRILLLGRADRATAAALFSHCDFFVLPSRQEPQGIVILEAMAAGRAVLAARVGGVPEIVKDEVNGLLTPGGEVDSLARSLVRMAGDPELRQRLGNAARGTATAFDWSAVADRYLRIYRELDGTSGRRSGLAANGTSHA